MNAPKIDAADDIDEAQAKLVAKNTKVEETDPQELGEKRGWEVGNEWSQGAPDIYDAKTALVQWNSFVDKGLTARTIIHFAKQNGFRRFDAEAVDAPEIKSNWVYVTSIKRPVEVVRLLEWDGEQFDANFASESAVGSPGNTPHIVPTKVCT